MIEFEREELKLSVVERPAVVELLSFSDKYDWFFEKLNKELADHVQLPCDIKFKVADFISGASGHYDPEPDEVIVNINEQSVTKIIREIMGNDSTLIQKLAQLYSPVFTEKNNLVREQKKQSRWVWMSIFDRSDRLGKKKEKQFQAIAEGSVVTQDIDLDELIIFGIGLVLDLREQNGSGIPPEKIEELKKDIADLAKLQRIFDLEKNLDHTLRHEGMHAKWSHELHRVFLTPEELKEVEDFLRESSFSSVRDEILPDSIELKRLRNLSTIGYQFGLNRKVVEEQWRKAPDELKKPFVYRAYMSGIEETLIPLLEIRDSKSVELYKNNFKKRIPEYGLRTGLLLLPKDKFLEIAALVENDEPLDEVIEELQEMMKPDAFTGFYDNFVNETENKQ
jgi:hypothetical protein